MEKYLIILIIIIILYYKQKYCIQSEVDKILITKNIIEKFTDNISPTLSEISNNLSQTGGLNLLGSLIINNRHKLTSDGNYLKITDGNSQNYLSLAVKDLDVSGTLLLRKNNFDNLPSLRFTNNANETLIIDILGNSVGIKSLQSSLNINAGTTINFSGNIDISGNLTISNTNRKPILIKTIDISNNINTYDTGISHTEYSGIAFSGSTRSYASTFQFNTYQQNGRWFISITPPMIITTPLGVRVTFFHVNFVGDEGITFTLLPPSVSASAGNYSGQIILTMTAPSNAPLNTITSYEVLDLPQGATAQSGLNINTIIISGLNDTDHTFIVEATNGSNTSTAQSQPSVKPPILEKPIVTASLVNPRISNIDLTWTAPSNALPGTITTYTVLNVPSNATVTYASGTTSKSAFISFVSSLNNNSSYTFNVQATNGLNSSIGTSNSITPIAQTLAEAVTKAQQEAQQAINEIQAVQISRTRLTIIDNQTQNQVEIVKTTHTGKQQTALTNAINKIQAAQTIEEIKSAQTIHIQELTRARSEAYTEIERIRTISEEQANTQRVSKAAAVLKTEKDSQQAINEIQAVQISRTGLTIIDNQIQNQVDIVKTKHTTKQQTALRNAINNIVVTQTIEAITSAQTIHTQELTTALNEAHAEILRIRTTAEEQTLIQRRAQQEAVKKAQNETQQAIQDIQALQIYKTGLFSINQTQESIIVKIKEIHSQQQTDILTKIIKAIQAAETIQAITDIQAIYTKELTAVRTAAYNDIMKVRAAVHDPAAQAAVAAQETAARQAAAAGQAAVAAQAAAAAQLTAITAQTAARITPTLQAVTAPLQGLIDFNAAISKHTPQAQDCIIL